MKYIDCLSRCVQRYGIAACLVDLYQSYPEPAADVWQTCVAEAEEEHGFLRSEFDCMARYEVLLEKQGIETVSGSLTSAALYGLIEGDSVPIEVILSEINRYQCANCRPA